MFMSKIGWEAPKKFIRTLPLHEGQLVSKEYGKIWSAIITMGNESNDNDDDLESAVKKFEWGSSDRVSLIEYIKLIFQYWKMNSNFKRYVIISWFKSHRYSFLEKFNNK